MGSEELEEMMEGFSSFDMGKFLTAKTGKVKQRSLRVETQWIYSKMGKMHCFAPLM